MPIIEYVTILHLFYILFLFNPEVYEILAPQLGIKTCTPCIGRPSLNPWTSREVPQLFISISISSWIFYYTLSYNPILINYVALIVLYLETASFSVALHVHLTSLTWSFLLSTSWTLGTTRNSMVILYIYCASLELQEALVVYWRVLETKSFVLGVILF